jgi:hypothetical protein
MKLKKLLPEAIAGKTPISRITNKDPESGSITWNISYKPDFTGIVKKYNELIRDIEKAVKSNNLQDDVVMKDVINKAKSNRTFLHKTLKRKYPEYIEKLSKR